MTELVSTISLAAAGGLVIHDLGALHPAGGEGILEFHLRLEGVLPHRRVVVAVTLTEQDPAGQDYDRGVLTRLLPAHTGETPQELVLAPFRFILPQELDVGEGGRRQFTVRAEAHYVDQGGYCTLPMPSLK